MAKGGATEKQQNGRFAHPRNWLWRGWVGVINLSTKALNLMRKFCQLLS
jgi:hypothetical protein